MAQRLEQAFNQGVLPLVAILRGITSSEVSAVGKAIIDSGISLIEVPMNSPRPIDSISALKKTFGDDIICGAGTVLNVAEVEQVHDAGGCLIVAPNCDEAVIKKALALGMIPIPGVATPTEAFTAINAGARYIKLFPAAGLGENYLKNMLAVLPKDITVLAVGGINASNMQSFWQAGARGFGIGGDIYQPGDSAATVAQKSLKIVEAFNSAK